MDKRAELAEVNEAISTILKGGQSYKIGSRSLSRADLSALLKMKNDIEQQLADETSGNGLMDNTTVGFFDRR